MKRKNKVFSREDILILFSEVSKHTDNSKKAFTKFETFFLLELFQEESKKSIIYVLVDEIIKDGKEGIFMMSKADKKRLQFAYHYLNTNGNATRAAISVGYSPKTARQAGYRTLRWIQNKFREVRN